MRKPMKTKVFSLVNDNLPAGYTLCLFYLTVLYGVSAAQPKLNYVVLLPARLNFPSMEKACLLLDGAINIPSYSVTVTLEYSGGSLVLFPKKGCPKLPFSCCPFTVPPPSQGNTEVATVKVVANGSISFTEAKQVIIQKISNGMLIQTDKGAYKPGETVYFRIVTLDNNFLCNKTLYNEVQLKDPRNNCIAQWLKVPTKMCIARLSFILSSEPILGTYSIIVENSQTQTFIVREGALPRFEITIEEPTQLYTIDANRKIKVCSRYTFWRGVAGSFKVRTCLFTEWMYDPNYCKTDGGMADDTGCFSTIWDTESLSVQHRALIDVSFKEKGTDLQLTMQKYIPIASSPYKVIYEEFPTYYRRGYPVTIRLFVQDQNGLPVPDKNVRITYGQDERNEFWLDEDRSTDKNGKVTFVLDTSGWGYKVRLQTDLDIKIHGKEIYPLYIEAASSLQLRQFGRVIPCGSTESVQVQYTINPLDLEEGTKSVNVYYIVLGKAGIMVNGTQTIQLKDSSSLIGIFQVPITFTRNFGPAPKMIAFLLLKDQVMTAGNLLIEVDTCLPNTASLKFASSKSSPKAQINLTLSSSAGSLCALRAVDKSAQIEFPDKELIKEMVFSLFPYSVREGYPYEVSEDRPDVCNWDGADMLPAFKDALSLFMDVGLKILTNLQITRPLDETICVPMKLDNFMGTDFEPPSSSNDVRKFFPETWLWSLVDIGASGNAAMTVTVPETITQFNAKIFCMGNIGFGLSSEVSLNVFKQFFIDLILPYSVVQGETLTVKAFVINFLTQCLKIQVSLLSSLNYKIENCRSCVYTKCICADELADFEWRVTANKIGLVSFTVRAEAIASNDTFAMAGNDTCAGKVVYVPPSEKVDMVVKQLLVKARGSKEEHAQNMLICLTDSMNNTEKPFSLEVPENLAKSSESAYISVTGDVLGTALQNLDRLVSMPSGCGEQNMLKVAPIIYVLEYLSATGQLGATLKDKALSYLQSGYQRELNYKHTDGSFSAFGERDSEGSTWLTAFVMKCFYQAKQYIFIDDQVLDQALNWLANSQNKDGCFTNRGKLIHTTMKGGVNDDLSLSAYITAALLECEGSVEPIKLDLALSCLRANVNATSNPYTLALMAYTFTLANDTGIREILLNRLDQHSESSGTDLYWPYTFTPSEGPGSMSASVELTSYVLLALVSAPAIKPEELKTASRIVSWLSKQQNPQGGFVSTQDTVVAIQAHAKYSKVTFNPSFNLALTVSANKVPQAKFQVNNTNRLLPKKQPLTKIPGTYQLSIRGIGCVLIQIVLQYNVLPAMEKSPFNISAKYVCAIQYNKDRLLSITFSYIGLRETTNMVLLEVEMQSGFEVREEKKDKFLTYPFVKRTEFSKDVFIVYLDELDHETQKYHIDLRQNMVIDNLQPANIKIYDFYYKEEGATTTYNICDPFLFKKLDEV